MCFTNSYYTDLINKYKYKFQAGDIVAGTIFSRETKGYLVDIGAKNVAYLPSSEISLYTDKNYTLVPNITSEFFILVVNNQSKQFILSLKRLTYIKSWERIKQLKHENIIIKPIIIGINKGGILVRVEKIQGFIPKSHIEHDPYSQPRINSSISCKFLFVNEYKNQLVLSNKCAILEEIKSKIKIGYTLEAPIIRIKSYGILVNIYNLPALLHISEISKQRLSNLNQLFTVGEIIKVRIIYINLVQGRLLVSRLNMI